MPCGSLTDSVASLSAAGLQDRDHLTALAVQGSIAATQEAFDLWCCGGNRIVAWGAPDAAGYGLENRIPCWCHNHRKICCDSGRWLRYYMGSTAGGDSSAVQCQLGHPVPDSGYIASVCCCLKGRISGDMGQCVFWWWQLHSARSAPKECSRFKPMVLPSPQSWKMDLQWHGALKATVVTALQYKISWRACSSAHPVCCDPRRWIRGFLGFFLQRQLCSGILRDGSVIACSDHGGDTSSIREDGSVVA